MPGAAADLELDVEDATLELAGGRTVLVGHNRNRLREPANRQQAEERNTAAENYISQRSPRLSVVIMAVRQALSTGVIRERRVSETSPQGPAG